MDFVELVKEVNYFSFITALAKWVFLFLLVSILLLIMGKKFGLFKRRTKIANGLVKFYYVLIPLYFVIFAFKYAPVKNSQQEMNKAVDNRKEVIIQFTYEFLNTIISDSLLAQKSSARDLVNGYLDAHIYAKYSLTQSQDLGIGEKILYKIKRTVEFSFLSSLVESKILNKTSELLRIDEKTGRKLYETNLYDMFKEGEIVEIFKIELNKVYSSYYKSLFLLFGIGLLVPVLEIILSRVLKY